MIMRFLITLNNLKDNQMTATYILDFATSCFFHVLFLINGDIYLLILL